MNVVRVLKQSIHSGVFFVLQAVSRLLLAVALGKSLSLHEYGSYTLVATAIAMAATVISFSTYQYYVREVPGRGEGESATIFKSVVGVQMLLTCGVAALICATPIVLPSFWRSFGLPEGGGLVLAMGGLLVLDTLAAELSRFLYARKEIEKGNIVIFLQTGFWAVVMFGIFLSRPASINLTLLLITWMGSLVMAVSYGVIHAGPKTLRNAPFKPALYYTAILFGAPLMLSYSIVLVNWIGRFILAGAHSSEVMGAFTYHLNIIFMIAAISAPLLSSPLEPYITEAHNTGQIGRSGQLLTMALRYRVMLIIPIVAVIIVWDEKIIGLMAKSDYAQAGLLMLLSPIPLLGILGSTFERVLFLERKIAAIGRSYVYAACSQLILFVILVPTNPYVGGALATDAGLAILVCLLRYSARSTSMVINPAMGRIALAAVPCFASTWAVSVGLAPFLSRLPLFVVSVGISAGIYLYAAYLLRVFSSEEIRALGDFLSGGRRRVVALFVGQPQ